MALPFEAGLVSRPTSSNRQLQGTSSAADWPINGSSRSCRSCPSAAASVLGSEPMRILEQAAGLTPAAPPAAAGSP